MSSRPFRFRLEQVREHRERREDLARQELAQAMAAIAAQQERVIAAQTVVDSTLAMVRGLMARPTGLDELRGANQSLAVARVRVAHDRSVVRDLEAVADDRRADLVRASQDREALEGLKRRAQERHRVEADRAEGIALDELATRRAARARAAA